jgi:hypothetical protein
MNVRSVMDFVGRFWRQGGRKKVRFFSSFLLFVVLEGCHWWGRGVGE